MDDYNTIKEWLIPLLEEKDMSVETFARQCGVSRATIYNYIVDRCRPTEETMVSMCAVLEVPLEEGLSQYTPRPNGRPTTRH